MAKGFFHQNNGKIVVLGDKKKLLAEIDEAIKKAPEKAKKTETIYEAVIIGQGYVYSIFIFDSSEADARARAEKKKIRDSESVTVNKIQVPACSIEFEIGGNCKVKIYNEKFYLVEFREKVGKTQETVNRPVAKVRKTPSFKPVAPKRESIEELVKVNRKGWFTDGHVLIKGEIPKGKKVGECSVDASEVMKNMEYGGTEPAELQYYYLSDPDIGNVVSRNPVLQFGERFPNVVFRIDGRYVVYFQGTFRAVKNRYPDAEYRIYPDAGMLGVYENRKLVGVVMPCQAAGQSECHKKYPTQMYVPPLRGEAIEAGFLKEKRKALEI